MSKTPATLQEAIIHYADFENCKEFMMNLRWSDGKVKCRQCPHWRAAKPLRIAARSAGEGTGGTKNSHPLRVKTTLQAVIRT